LVCVNRLTANSGTLSGRPRRIAVLSALKAGLAYALIVFAFAFATGALRTMLLAQDLGLTPVTAVLMELPLILLVAWIACRAVLRRVPVPARAGPRLAMGIVALVTIVALEFAVAVMVTGSSFAGFLANYGKREVMLGLIGQIAFAAFPLARMNA